MAICAFEIGRPADCPIVFSSRFVEFQAYPFSFLEVCSSEESNVAFVTVGDADTLSDSECCGHDGLYLVISAP
jgi:hypothetical protein